MYVIVVVDSFSETRNSHQLTHSITLPYLLTFVENSCTNEKMGYDFQPVTRPDPVDLEEDETGSNTTTAEEEASTTIRLVTVTVESVTDLDTATMVDDDDNDNNKSNPYCEVTAGGMIQKTDILHNNDSKLYFCVAEHTNTIAFRVMDHAQQDDNEEDVTLGKAQLDLTSLNDGTFCGALAFEEEDHDGKLNVHVECRQWKPIVETETKLKHWQTKLTKKCKEQIATVAALDESERLRKEVTELLSLQEEQKLCETQELLRQQEELSQQELSKYKHQQAQEMESMVQQWEETKLLLSQKEQTKKELELGLQTAQEELIRSKEALIAKETEMEEVQERMEQAAETVHSQNEQRIEELETIQAELEQDVKTKERVIHSQGKILDQNKAETTELVATKESLLVENQELQQRLEQAETSNGQHEKRIQELETIQAELEQDVQTKERVIHSQGKILDQNKVEFVAAQEQLQLLLADEKKKTSQVVEEEEEKKEETPPKEESTTKKEEMEKLQVENDDLKFQLQQARVEIETISSTQSRYEQQKQSEVNTLYQKNETLRNELKIAKEQLETSKAAFLDKKAQEQACGDANCVVM